jgi:hypothetical protein
MGVRRLSFLINLAMSGTLTVDFAFVYSTPVALAFEKFYIPDAVRVMDAIISTFKF